MNRSTRGFQGLYRRSKRFTLGGFTRVAKLVRGLSSGAMTCINSGKVTIGSGSKGRVFISASNLSCSVIVSVFEGLPEGKGFFDGGC